MARWLRFAIRLISGVLLAVFFMTPVGIVSLAGVPGWVKTMGELLDWVMEPISG